jgi:hypothetical protein
MATAGISFAFLTFITYLFTAADMSIWKSSTFGIVSVALGAVLVEHLAKQPVLSGRKTNEKRDASARKTPN